MMKQKDIAQILDRHPSEISRVLTGKRKVPWSMASQLSKLLPGKTTEEWKHAGPKALKFAFILIEQNNTTL